MRRLLDIALVVVLILIGLLVWAGQQKPPDRYLQEITQRGALRVGLDPTYPPFESLRDSTPVGYDVDLARAIASDLGVQVEFHTLALDTLYDSLAADKVDVLISALPFVYERQKEVRYSIPYYQAGQVIVVSDGNTSIKSPDDLQGKKVGVELGSNADTEARLLLRTKLSTMQLRSSYHSTNESMQALAQGDLDAAITDNTSAQVYIAAHPGSLQILSPSLTDEPYVVAMPAQASVLVERVNATIARLRASGDLAKMMGISEELGLQSEP
jgi:polar amino acid transport system substrate-binding protein